jgi:hypothetical protein
MRQDNGRWLVAPEVQQPARHVQEVKAGLLVGDLELHSPRRFMSRQPQGALKFLPARGCISAAVIETRPVRIEQVLGRSIGDMDKLEIIEPRQLRAESEGLVVRVSSHQAKVQSKWAQLSASREPLEELLRGAWSRLGHAGR